MLSNNATPKGLWILNNPAPNAIVAAMKQILTSSLAGAFAIVIATGVHAACYADYKAKQDNPLRLHYGVLQIDGECAKSAAKAEASDRLNAAGWTLLNVLGVFDDSGLAERKDSAGEYYLRF